jgi:hypothetical protein
MLFHSGSGKSGVIDAAESDYILKLMPLETSIGAAKPGLHYCDSGNP